MWPLALEIRDTLGGGADRRTYDQQKPRSFVACAPPQETQRFSGTGGSSKKRLLISGGARGALPVVSPVGGSSGDPLTPSGGSSTYPLCETCGRACGAILMVSPVEPPVPGPPLGGRYFGHARTRQPGGLVRRAAGDPVRPCPVCSAVRGGAARRPARTADRRNRAAHSPGIAPRVFGESDPRTGEDRITLFF